MAKMDFLFICKPDAHALLYEWVADFTRTGEVRTLEKSRWNRKQHLSENGLGVPKDEARALELYQQAADQGHPAAQANIDARSNSE